MARKKNISKLAQVNKRINLGDSYASLVVGLIVVVIAAILIFSFGKNRHIKETSSVQDGPVLNKEKKDKEKNSKNQETYVVKTGDYLWDISVRVYGDGYKWVDIAKANNLTNPDLIFSENILKIPR